MTKNIRILRISVVTIDCSTTLAKLPSCSIDALAVRVIIKGLRCIATGLDFCDGQSWTIAWRCYCAEFGSLRAWCLCSELQMFVHALRRSSGRSIDFLCFDCPYLSEDETNVLILLFSTHREAKEQAAGALFGYNRSTEQPVTSRRVKLLEAARYLTSSFETWCADFSRAGQLFVDRDAAKHGVDALPCSGQVATQLT